MEDHGTPCASHWFWGSMPRSVKKCWMRWWLRVRSLQKPQIVLHEHSARYFHCPNSPHPSDLGPSNHSRMSASSTERLGIAQFRQLPTACLGPVFQSSYLLRQTFGGLAEPKPERNRRCFWGMKHRCGGISWCSDPRT